MAHLVTLAQMRTQAREAADMVGSDFVSDSELNTLINAYAAELYDLLVSCYGHSFYATTYTFTMNAPLAKYAVPDNNSGPGMLQLLGIDIDTGDGILTAEPYNFHNRNDYQSTSSAWNRYSKISYRIQGNSIWFAPEPQGNYRVTVHYVPCMTTVTADSGTFDTVNGWERYIVVSAAIAMLQKEQSDPSILMNEKLMLKDRITFMAKNRDAGEPDQVVNKRGRRTGHFYY